MSFEHLYSVEADRRLNWSTLVEWFEQGGKDWDDLKSVVTGMVRNMRHDQMPAGYQIRTFVHDKWGDWLWITAGLYDYFKTKKVPDTDIRMVYTQPIPNEEVTKNLEIAHIIFNNDREGAVKWAKNLAGNMAGIRPVKPVPVGWIWEGGTEPSHDFKFGPFKPDERANWIPVFNTPFVHGDLPEPKTEEISYVLDQNRDVHGGWRCSVKDMRKFISDFLHIRNNPIGS